MSLVNSANCLITSVAEGGIVASEILLRKGGRSREAAYRNIPRQCADATFEPVRRKKEGYLTDSLMSHVTTAIRGPLWAPDCGKIGPDSHRWCL